jgi:hypothetical protein
MDTTKKVLFLDDDADRAHAFKVNHKDRNDLKIMHVETAMEARMCLQERHWDVVCLDHDLSDNHNFTGMHPGDGMEVVDWMILNMTEPHERPELVVVHSWNSQRAPEMEARLHDAGFNVIRQMFTRNLRLS